MIEFGVAAVVPEMCGVLSELGADVIKIESRANLDVLRMGSGKIELIDKNFTFNDECRGRRSVALDLNTERGRELALALCASADVVAENQRGGALERRGLGYDDVRAVNPRVVYASSQGYGRGGPFGEMPAYGPLNSGFSGVHLLWNHPDAPYPCGTSMNHPDHIAGRLLAVGVLAALAEREVSGEGQHLELAQTEAAAYLIGEVYLEAARAGVDPAPLGNAHPHASPHGVYPSAGTDQWIAIAVMDDDAWAALCAAVGWDDDPALRTASPTGRRPRRARRPPGGMDEHADEGGRGRLPAGPRRLGHAGHGSGRPSRRPTPARTRRDRHAAPPRGRRRTPHRQPAAVLAPPATRRAERAAAWAPTPKPCSRPCSASTRTRSRSSSPTASAGRTGLRREVWSEHVRPRRVPQTVEVEEVGREGAA